ncbi:host cell division inhibitor Icd-like protein [Enterobacter hormaechei]
MAQISASIAGGSLMPAVQKRAFPLAGLLYALRGITHAHVGIAGINAPANASPSFSRRGDEESFETSTRPREGFPLAGLMYADSNDCGQAKPNPQKPETENPFPLIAGGMKHVATAESRVVMTFATSTREFSGTLEATFVNSTREGVFGAVRARARGGEGFSDITTRDKRHIRSRELSESIKKGLPTITNPVYGYSALAKSGAGIGVLVIRMATYDAPSVFFYVVNSVHLFFSVAGIIRAAHKIMVGCVGASSEAPVTIRAGYANPAQLTTSKIGVFGGGVIPNRMEAAAMLATTPTQNPQFIWLIAAVRRDIPTITAKIHHIAAETEREARRTLARDHVCFFAGRIRLEVAA